MYARFVVNGQEQLRATIVARERQLSDFSPLLSLAGSMERDSATMRIRQEGVNVTPPWMPSKKTKPQTFTLRSGETVTVPGSGRTGVDTRAMANSIDYQVTSANHVKIGTNIPYAYWFQFGSGIFAGHDPWTINPRDKRVLSWSVGGVRFIARQVTIPGQPPRPFLFFSDEDVKAILAVWSRRLSGSGV